MSRHVGAWTLEICLKGIFTLPHCMYTHSHSHTHIHPWSSTINCPSLCLNWVWIYYSKAVMEGRSPELELPGPRAPTPGLVEWGESHKEADFLPAAGDPAGNSEGGTELANQC